MIAMKDSHRVVAAIAIFDKLVSAVIQEEGKEQSLEWSLNEDGSLDLYTE
jgi:hypothetical protein